MGANHSCKNRRRSVPGERASEAARGPEAPLFSFHRKPFSCNNFLSALSTKLRALGLKANGYPRHSFRKGAAQYAHDSGILDD
ncbi:Integrase-like, catalytic core [Penicillium expansum]|uniref:Integrase-like, catalytic core n=1 Tax=Penicillium expansum TaxID=27334 RepID=A0A0A2IAM9_PENEN|nr:Integrase-like, catalytic core [Penicillium expansum]KGO40099.1 Integrase-like, catalytic core [Penicillium expansum]KGO46355.1 Integrase-like, catalytic core [Penicillium expansum]KGO53137.1 Integrase-like, catalytic core [Penicillium expansum]